MKVNYIYSFMKHLWASLIIPSNFPLYPHILLFLSLSLSLSQIERGRNLGTERELAIT